MPRLSAAARNLLVRIDIALEKARWRQLPVRTIYLDDEAMKLLWHPQAYRGHKIRVTHRKRRHLCVYLKTGVYVCVPHRLSAMHTGIEPIAAPDYKIIQPLT